MKIIFKSSILSSLSLAILGALLIFESEATIVSISYIIGGILVAIGTLGVVKFVNNLNKNVKNELDMVYGIVTVIMGIIVISYPKAIASIIPIVIGVGIIISSAIKLQYSLEMRKDNNSMWKSTMILSLITIACGILLLFNPFKGAEFITKIVGLLIFIYAILDLISTLAIKRTSKIIHKAIAERAINEAEVIEEDEEVAKNKNKKNKREED